MNNWRDPLGLNFLENNPKVAASRKHVLVAFGDISDFASWTRRGSNSPEEFKSFMIQVYREFIRFRNGSGYFVKLIGDGLMAIKELSPKNAFSDTMAILRHSCELDESITRIIAKTHYPRPNGFRIRIVAGHVWKLTATHTKNEKRKQTDYLGYSINLASRLLEVERAIPCLCHQSVKETIDREEHLGRKIKLLKVKKPTHCPRGVDVEDMEALWSFRAIK